MAAALGRVRPESAPPPAPEEHAPPSAGTDAAADTEGSDRLLAGSMPPLRRAASLMGAAARAEVPLHRETQPRNVPRAEPELASAAAAVELPPRPGSSGSVASAAGAAKTDAQAALPEALLDAAGRARRNANQPAIGVPASPSAAPYAPLAPARRGEVLPHVGMPPLVARPMPGPGPQDYASPEPEAPRAHGLYDGPQGELGEPKRILTPLMTRPPLGLDESARTTEQPVQAEPLASPGHGAAGHAPPVSQAPARPGLPLRPDTIDRPPPAPMAPPPAVSPGAVPGPPPQLSRLGHLALIDDNGAESIQFPLILGENRIGSGEGCQLRFPDDGFLTRVHCIVHVEPSKMTLRPVDYGNGVYVRISTPIELHHGDTMRIGQEVLRFERIDRLTPEINYAGKAEMVGFPLAREVWGRLCQIGLGRQVANAYVLSTPDVFLGRERGDILFPRDGFVSGSHAVVSERNGRCFLKDLVSSNGTFIRAKQDTPLRNGDLFLLGRNLLRVHLGPPT
ncbi:MAG: FHA domain-containing protein [Deltaproteobacteria bacterium]|nr:FHA domain-containing protein [Deltaproteobacteria bacterium]